ncbi:MAG: O-antigen ligase family protein [Bacillota bacterium]|nr:O-antigen ligase family protein [Bacillota bacterium]
MKNSIIINALITTFATLKNWFENSGYFKIWNAIMDFFGRLYNNSLTGFIFSRKQKKSNVEYSFFSKIINHFYGLMNLIIGNPCRKIAREAGKGVIVTSLKYLFDNWQYISIRYYAIWLFAYGSVSMAMDRAAHGFISNRWIVVTIIAFVAMFINVSFSALYRGEFFIRLFKTGGFENDATIDVKHYKVLAISIISGALFGVCYIVPNLQIFIVAVAALIILAAKPGWLIFISIVLFPFLPTMAVVGVMIYAMLLMLFQYILNGEINVHIDIFDIAMAGMGFVFVYGTLNSFTPIASLKITAVYLVFVLFFYVLRRYCNTEKNYMTLIDWLIVSTTGVAGYGIIEQLLGLSKTTWQDSTMFEDISGRACSTFGNPNVLGEFLLLTIPITIARIITSKSSKGKVFFTLSAATQMLCMIYTYSRGCWIGLIFALALLFALCTRKLFVFMTAGIFALPFVVPQNVVDRLLSVGNTSDTSTAYRVFIWEGTFRMLKDYWLTGVGLGTAAFNTVYPFYALGAISAPHAHNLYLHIFSETGIIGAFIFVFTLITFYRYIGHVCKVSKRYRPLALALATGMGGYLVQGMFDNVWYNYRIFAFFFVMLAFAAALKDIAEDMT